SLVYYSLFYLYLIFLIYFFSSFALIYRYLLYFPTRRSSDLIIDILRQSGMKIIGCSTHMIEALLWEERGIDAHFLQGMESGGMRDRKSTRLNSSHVSISYAVFCLKKKNIYN